MSFCHGRETNPFQASLYDGIEYLAQYFYNKGIGYSALNSARSALSTLIMSESGITFGKHPLVTKLLRGAFIERPSLPRYATTWDVNHMLKYIKTLKPLAESNLKEATLRLVMLLCLTTGQRDQVLKYFNIDNMVITPSEMSLFVPHLLKTTRPGKHLPPLTVKRLILDNQLCAVSHMEHYLNLTKDFREDNYIFLSTRKPHKPVVTSTISRCRNMLQMAGVDISVFVAFHSVCDHLTCKTSWTKFQRNQQIHRLVKCQLVCNIL